MQVINYTGLEMRILELRLFEIGTLASLLFEDRVSLPAGLGTRWLSIKSLDWNGRCVKF